MYFLTIFNLKRFYTFLNLILLTLVTCITTFSQVADERWSFPKTILKPTGETVDISEFKDIPPSTEYKEYLTKTGKVTIGPNVRMWPNPASTQSEMAICTHPTNPNIVFAGSNAAGNPTVNWLSQGWYITSNGGTSWYGSDTLPPHVVGGFSKYTSDPVTAIDLNGNLYFNTIFYSSSSGDIVVTKSTNMGTTWSNFVSLPDPGIDEDKNWMTVDVNPSSPYVGNIYVAYTDFNSTGGAYRRIRFGRSTNQGDSFTPNPTVNISGTQNYLDQGVNLAVGPNGEVYATWSNYITSSLTSSNVGFTKSTDGGVTFSTPIFTTTNVLDIRGNLVKGGNTIRVSSFPAIDVDRSETHNRGNIYIVYPAKNPTAPDIFLLRSTNGGANWSSPIRVNTADVNKDQWYPSVAVDPATGAVYVVYYDSREFPSNDSACVYISRSLDGGLTFEDIKISDRNFLPKSITGLATGYMGDYIDIAALNGIVWPVWNDNRTGWHQGYTAKVIFGPTINHTKLPNTENLNGPYTVTAEISSSIPLDLNNIKVYWGRGSSFTDSVLMTNTSGNNFTANIPGNSLPATYRYYIYAKDNAGGFSSHPGGAPSAFHSFEVGIDNTPPVVTSTPLGNQYREMWPAKVSAIVTDNIGIDSVWVEWTKNDVPTVYKFRLNLVSGSLYEGLFNRDSSFFVLGDSVSYKVFARDNSSNANVGFTPATGFFKFNFIPDTEFPVITHSAIRNQPKLRWPTTVKATITDNMGIDSAWIEYYKNIPALSGKFYLVNLSGNLWEAVWNLDTSQVQIGDSLFYKIVARDKSTNRNITYNPSDGLNKFAIISTKGIVLVVDDDGTALKDGFEKSDKGDYPYKAELKGVTSRLIQRTLIPAGYIVDTVSFAIHDASQYPNYDIVVWTGGTRGTGVFGDQAKRTALINRANAGGKIWVEGGEVGYVYRWQTTEIDKNFRQQVLKDSSWLSDVTAASLVVTRPTHAIFTIPNLIAGPVAFTGTSIGSRDAMRLIPGDAGAYKVAGWSTYTTQGPDTCAMIIYDNNPNPLSAQTVFFPFALSSITDTTIAKQLIENTAEYLMTPEPPPTGSLAGVVSLQGTSDWSGVKVKIQGLTLARLDSVITGTDGVYSFAGLYAGNYRIIVSKAGYVPFPSSRDTSVGTAPVSGFNFALNQLLATTVSGTVTLAGQSDHSGVTVSVVGQGLSGTTNTAGAYTISDIYPGNITLRATKAGFKSMSKDTTIANGQSIVVNFALPVETILVNETFENVAVDGIPAGWTRIDVNGDGNTWKTVSDALYNITPGGIKGIKYTYHSSNAANDWLITPALDLQGGIPHRVTFYYRTNSASYIEKIEVMWGTSPTAAALTNLVWRKEDITNITFAKAEATLLVPTTGTYYVGWRVYSVANQFNPGLDDIKIEVAPTKDVGVSKLWVFGATENVKRYQQPDEREIARINEAERKEAELVGKAAGNGYIDWVQPETENEDGYTVTKKDSVVLFAEVMNFGTESQTGFNVRWTVSGSVQTPVAVTKVLGPGTRDTVKLVWLTPSTGLHPAVAWTDLSDDADRGNDTAKTTINVPPPGIILSESFESGLTLPAGWSTAVVTTGTTLPAWTIITGAGTNPAAPPFHGNNQARFNSYNATSGSQARLTTKRLTLPAGGARATFWMYHDNGYTTSFDSITVQATTGDSITGPWTRLGSYQRYAATNAWRKDSVDLAAFGGQSKVYVSFLATSRYGNNMYLDQVEVYPYTVTDYLTVTSPNGGEWWQIGQQYSIVWSHYGATTVKIEYSTNSGSSWIEIVASVPAKTESEIIPKLAIKGSGYTPEGLLKGSYLWTVPNTPTDNALVRVTANNNPALTDVSNGVFKISVDPPPVPPQWTSQISPVTTTLQSVKAVSAQVGWICGNAGRVLRTINGGTTWTAVTNPSTLDNHNIEALDENTAFVLANGTDDARMYRTTNGGSSWSLVYSSTASGAFFNVVKMFDATNGYMQGDPVGSPLKYALLKTTDGGATWTSASDLAPAISTEYGWNNSHFWLDNQRGWFGTNNSRIYYTTNGGANWTSGTTPLLESPSIWFKDVSNGLSGTNAASNATPTIASSTNGGTSWTNITSPVTGRVYGMHGSGNKVWVTSGINVLWTTNMGTSWATQYPGTGTAVWYHLSMLKAGSQIVGWAVRSNGEIIKYTETEVGVPGDGKPGQLPDKYVLEQSYPNPFNPSTNIGFELPTESMVTLKVYDVLGREVATLIDRSRISAGTHSVEFNGGHLTSGVYFYRISAEGVGSEAVKFSQIKKMLMMK